MITLKKSLQAWGHTDFNKVLKQELESLETGSLPLHKATCQGGLVDDSNISALINSASETDTHIEVNIGVFFNEIVAGCNCGDDPSTDNTYCELCVQIDKDTAISRIILLS